MRAHLFELTATAISLFIFSSGDGNIAEHWAHLSTEPAAYSSSFNMPLQLPPADAFDTDTTYDASINTAYHATADVNTLQLFTDQQSKKALETFSEPHVNVFLWVKLL
ncbi:MAG: hypothetical protein CO186_12765 [Zetaproteobacteria bacterium CG_4_9_14_3_um_filter_49_83]|nr:MAG: hypothetical protein AUJ56_01525 [Zetaproteobacteria bacterium CG1_02_49_23]PIQ33980.1 MAG: hypothetical protein COW62_03560 [Zetaproteobacteria bacterium CG17_big_fil_post_rev_8_21_14_2_50_50_13]PIY56495.1 MAG: hypothetical protein COZ00_03870 [Zetaproteobacteria bacterium CG_4_10_14_0_8_um_filter_49_80]PJA33800.1 MAG: hypothetical protein CO186_12765 [Zetaproteobacteria bacterium CG_4_9_14_3_um_filter_49_83]